MARKKKEKVNEIYKRCLDHFGHLRGKSATGAVSQGISPRALLEVMMQNVRFVLPSRPVGVVRASAFYENRAHPAIEVPSAATAALKRQFEKIASESAHGARGEGRGAHWASLGPTVALFPQFMHGFLWFRRQATAPQR